MGVPKDSEQEKERRLQATYYTSLVIGGGANAYTPSVERIVGWRRAKHCYFTPVYQETGWSDGGSPWVWDYWYINKLPIPGLHDLQLLFLVLEVEKVWEEGCHQPGLLHHLVVYRRWSHCQFVPAGENWTWNRQHTHPQVSKVHLTSFCGCNVTWQTFCRGRRTKD